jgi:hypothetical protein
MKLDDVDRLMEITRERSHAKMHLQMFEDMKKLGVKNVIIGFDNPNAIRMESFGVPFSSEVMLAIQHGLHDKIMNLENEMKKFGVEL